MITSKLTLASLAALLAAPAFAVTDPTPATTDTAATQTEQDEFDLDENDLDAPDDLVTEEDLDDETEIVDTELGKEQEPDETITVEPKDDGQDVIMAAEEYLAKTTVKDAELADAGPAPRREEVEVQLPDATDVPEPEVAPVRQPQQIADALRVNPQDLKSPAFVKKIQEALIADGAAIEADGQMGAATKQALIDYQKKNGLAADGVAGPGTLAKLGLAP